MVRPVLDEARSRDLPTWLTLVAVALFYAVCVLVATYPMVLTLNSRLPTGLNDVLQHLWVMRWYKTCLLHARSPLHCPDLQFPTGAHLGNFSPLYLQALLYIPLSVLVRNDVLCYNLLWLGSLVFTGFGTFLALWHLLGQRTSACLGGLLAMLSGPVLVHALGHLELINLGWIPLFLLAWMRWVDRPTWGRLVGALAAYVLVTLGAAYFAVFAVVPAATYVVARAGAGGFGGVLPWLRQRVLPLVAFTALSAPCLLILFAPQLSSRAEGYSLARAEHSFNAPGVPPWSYVAPSHYHTLGRLLLDDSTPPACRPIPDPERCSYLGLVTLVLIGYAGLTRSPLPRARFWWAVFAILVVLSFGGTMMIGSRQVSLPAEWLRRSIFVFRFLRGTHRFNLFVVIVGAVLAAAGLRHFLGRFRSRPARLAVGGLLSLAAVADLGIVPFPTLRPMPVPTYYALLLQRHPGATFLELPQVYTGTGRDCQAYCMYWQSLHHGATTAGYSGVINYLHHNRFVESSPFALDLLQSDNYLQTPEAVALDLVAGVRFADYAWLYLSVHHLDYILLHRRAGDFAGVEASAARLRAQLECARDFEDEDVLAYDSSRLPPPRRPVLLCTTGWGPRGRWCCQRRRWYDHPSGVASRQARLAVYNPNADQPLMFTLDAMAFREARTVRLRAGAVELARWDVSPDEFHVYSSPPIRLRAGQQELVLESDGESRPADVAEAAVEADPGPYSLRVARVGLSAFPPRGEGP